MNYKSETRNYKPVTNIKVLHSYQNTFRSLFFPRPIGSIIQQTLLRFPKTPKTLLRAWSHCVTMFHLLYTIRSRYYGEENKLRYLVGVTQSNNLVTGMNATVDFKNRDCELRSPGLSCAWKDDKGKSKLNRVLSRGWCKVDWLCSVVVKPQPKRPKSTLIITPFANE